MTLDVIQRYFTQIGKSFYKSPDYSAEQAEFRRRGLISTPISQFGIGILSCFMLADRLTVRTNPGGGQPAADLEISGPGSLFWTRPGTRATQGTEITLWLRSTHRLPLDHDRDAVFSWLRDAFSYPGGANPTDDQRRDPGFIAASHVVWPRYPVHVAPPAGDRWTIDHRFHLDHLAPLDPEEFNAKLREWDYPVLPGREPRWDVYDWEDIHRPDASATRLRIWHPVQPAPDLAWWELHAFVEPQVKQLRPLLLVQGMLVPDVKSLLNCLPCASQAGCRVWIDLRGALAPSLTADRKMARTQDFDAAAQAWQSLLAPSPQAPAILRQTAWRESLQNRFWAGQPAQPSAQFFPPPFEARQRRLAAAALFVDLDRDLALARDLDLDLDLALAPARDLALARARDLALARARDLARDLDLALARARTRAFALARARARDLARERALARDLALALALARARDLARDFDFAVYMFPSDPLSLETELALHTSFLQEAFLPDLTRSWPPLELQAFDGQIGDAILTAPAAFRFELNGRRVLFADQSGTLPPELARHGYDLCFPMSAIPLGRLRRDFPQWRDDRRYRPLAVLPFLLPDLAHLWPKHTKELLRTFAPLDSLYALQPADSLWYTPFAAWTPADWQHPGHQSILWNIRTGKLTRLPGVHPRPTHGR